MTFADFCDISVTMLGGFGTTCLLFLQTLVLAIPLGLIITFGSITKFKPLKALVKCFVWIIRGTPLMLQIFVVFYIPSYVFGWSMQSRELAVLIAFVINYGCYFSEIYRGGIESISKGQYEAGKVLGMKKGQIFFHIVLPQVVKRIVPPMSNEIITLVKDTSLARIIGVVELIHTAQKFLTKRALIWPLFYAGVFYLIFNGLLTILLGKLEKRLDYYKI